MPKPTTPDMRDLLAAIQAMPAPRTQAEWRAASTAMRSVRREADRRRYHCEPHIPVDGFRRRLCVAHTGGNAVYVGPSPIADIGMIAFNRHQHIARIGSGRLADALVWAARSRAAGPVPLP